MVSKLPVKRSRVLPVVSSSLTLPTIKISREEIRVKPRSKIQPSKPYRDKSKYTRKAKHAGR